MTTRLTPSLSRLAGASALLIASLCTTQAQAATINVSVNGDNASQGIVSPSPNGADGLCSLIGAIINANADNQSGDIDCAAGSGVDTIVLPSNVTFTLDRVVDDTENIGLPLINSAITIQGNGSTIQRSTAADTPNFRILLQSGSSSDLTLQDLTLQGGQGGSGGAIFIGGGNFAMRRCSVVGNSSLSGGGGLSLTAGANALIEQSLIANNTTFGPGGGLSAFNLSTVTLRNSTVSGNTAPGFEQGGGIFIASGVLTVLNSTITGNSAGFSGGISSNAATVNLRNSIISGNTASSSVAHEWSAGAAQSIVSNNNVLGDSSKTFATSFSSVIPGTSDRVATSTAGPNALHVPTSLAGILNTTLANNGGPTRTHALVTGSPAINAADPLFTDSTPAAGTALRRDQRRYRLADGDTRRDIGAFELNGVSLAPTVTALSPATGPASGGTRVTITGTNFGGDTGPVVKFGTVDATGITRLNATTIEANSPAGTGTVNVTVTTDEGTSANNGTLDDFTYQSSVNGVCGDASGFATATAPAANLCATGTATAVSGNSTAWTWGCNGSGSGSTSTAADACTAGYPKPTLSLTASASSIAIGGATSVASDSDNGAKPTLSVSTPATCGLGPQTNSPTGVVANVSGTSAGTCTVAANLAAVTTGVTRYLAADPKTVSISVTKQDQTISFGAAPSGVKVDGTGTVSATASSGLTVDFSTAMSNTCSVSGSTVSGLKAGSCTVFANQAGDATHNAAPQVSQTFTIAPGSQSITGFAASPASLSFGGTSTLSATKGKSSAAVVYSSKTQDFCTVSGNTVSAVGVGTCTVAANQAGDADYTAAPEVTLNISIGQASQSITGFAASPASIAIGGSSSLSATKGAGSAAIVYSSKTTSICTVSGSTVTAQAVGACTVAANQAGDAYYTAAPEVTLNIAVQSSCKAFESRANVNIIDVSASPGGQTVRGEASRFNVIYGSGFADTITGGNAGNCIDAGAGNDRLTAGNGENHLYGGAGNDTLTPGSGSTAMDGGPGTDKCLRASSRASATYASCESF